MTKYNIGDKVRVRTDLSKGIRYYMADKSISEYVVDKMMKFAGKIVTITRAGIKYGIEECGWSWTDEMFEGKVNENKIVITTDGTETLARLYEDNKVIKRAVAKCSPDDTFNFETGAKIAFDRLIENKPVKEWRVVYRPAKVGDYIRIKRKVYTFNEKGDILRVDKNDGVVGVYGENHPRDTTNEKKLWHYPRGVYDVIEPIETPEENPKYYNGKVVCVEVEEGYAYTLGKIYEFKDGKMVNDNGYYVPLDDRIITLDDWDKNNWYCKFIPLVE